MIQEIALFLDKFQTKAWFRTLACSVLSLNRKILDLGLSVETPPYGQGTSVQEKPRSDISLYRPRIRLERKLIY